MRQGEGRSGKYVQDRPPVWRSSHVGGGGYWNLYKRIHVGRVWGHLCRYRYTRRHPARIYLQGHRYRRGPVTTVERQPHLDMRKGHLGSWHGYRDDPPYVNGRRVFASLETVFSRVLKQRKEGLPRNHTTYEGDLRRIRLPTWDPCTSWGPRVVGKRQQCQILLRPFINTFYITTFLYSRLLRTRPISVC